MVEGGMKCVKYLLFAFNLLFFLCGLGLIIVGAVVQARFSDYATFFEDAGGFGSAAIYVIIIGVIILAIAFFGCCGAFKENYCMVMTFAGLLILIFILEIAAGIAGFVLKGEIENLFETGLNKTLEAARNDNSKEADRKVWDLTQKEFKCCGASAASDWQGYKNDSGISTNDTVPDSCCKEIVLGCGVNAIGTDGIWKDNCKDAFEKYVSDNIYYIGAVGIAWAFIEIMGIIFACCLGRSIRGEHQSV